MAVQEPADITSPCPSAKAFPDLIKHKCLLYVLCVSTVAERDSERHAFNASDDFDGCSVLSFHSKCIVYQELCPL